MENLTEQQILSAYSDFLSRIPYAANKSDSTVNNYCKILFEHELFRKYPECQINPEPGPNASPTRRLPYRPS